jgi:alkylation response protein AidB-like acyl-CoA dehydrogenase
VLAPLPLTRIPEEDEALREPVRAFLREALTGMSPEQRARSWMGFDAYFSHKMAEKGWVGITLPKKYGGAERSPFARFVLVEEMLAAGAPVAAHWIADRQSAPLILRYGTEAQRELYLPRICRAEAFFCIGMSEPNAGSDLASVQTRATKVDRGWRLRGTKLWTTHAHRSHYVIALARSSGTAEDRQKGLSQFVIDLKTPGVKVNPIRDLTGDAHFSEIVFDDVLLGEDALIGKEGAGWEQVNAELAFERSGPERLLSSIVLVDEWLAWLRERGDDAPAESVAALGRIAAQLTVLRRLSIAVTSKLVAGESPVTEAALVKDLGTTLEQQIPDVIARLIGAEPDVTPPAPLLRTLSFVARIAPTYSLRGGTREILRGMITRGLGLR